MAIYEGKLTVPVRIKCAPEVEPQEAIMNLLADVAQSSNPDVLSGRAVLLAGAELNLEQSGHDYHLEITSETPDPDDEPLPAAMIRFCSTDTTAAHPVVLQETGQIVGLIQNTDAGFVGALGVKGDGQRFTTDDRGQAVDFLVRNRAESLAALQVLENPEHGSLSVLHEGVNLGWLCSVGEGWVISSNTERGPLHCGGKGRAVEMLVRSNAYDAFMLEKLGYGELKTPLA